MILSALLPVMIFHSNCSEHLYLLLLETNPPKMCSVSTFNLIALPLLLLSTLPLLSDAIELKKVDLLKLSVHPLLVTNLFRLALTID